jgi:tRNA1(Val) A37 N6-methylase TrmN6
LIDQMQALTIDSFFNGGITVVQPRNGYRYSIDAVLLAGIVEMQGCETVYDLGTGVGIIPLILAHRYPHSRIRAIEVQPELAELAVLNADKNGMSDQISIIRGDMRRFRLSLKEPPGDWVVANPPYRKARSGRINPQGQKAVARHEIKVKLPDVMAAASRLLKIGGNFATIYPCERLVDVLVHMRLAGIEPKKLLMVHSDRASLARLVLVTGKKGGRPGIGGEKPLFIYDGAGGYTEEMQKFYST